MDRYAAMFTRLQSLNQGAFVPFTVIGDPDIATSKAIIETLIEAGADALELAIPFSDPVADGPTIQAATQRALATGVTPKGAFAVLEQVRHAHPDIPVGLLLYANLVTARGLDEFYKEAARVGVDSILVADVPAYEAEPFVEAAHRHGVCPVLIAPPDASDDRLKQIARLARGYTYVLARAGVTGADQEVSRDIGKLLSRLRDCGAPPAVVGFGISRPEHVRIMLDAGAAGAISGSAVVKIIESHAGDWAEMDKQLRGFVAKMKAATQGR